MLRIRLHIEKGPLAASCSKPLLFMSMEANVAVCRFLMRSRAKNMKRFGGCLFSQNINHAQIQKFTATTRRESPK